MKFILPLSITLPRKTKKDKVCYLNLNNYRNWDFFLSNDLKKRYREALADQLTGVKVSTPCRLKFTLYRKDRRMGDRANYLCVQEKFFCDAMTHYGCWPDDTDKYIISSEYHTGAISKDNPRVEVELY